MESCFERNRNQRDLGWWSGDCQGTAFADPRTSHRSSQRPRARHDAAPSPSLSRTAPRCIGNLRGGLRKRGPLFIFSKLLPMRFFSSLRLAPHLPWLASAAGFALLGFALLCSSCGEKSGDQTHSRSNVLAEPPSVEVPEVSKVPGIAAPAETETKTATAPNGANSSFAPPATPPTIGAPAVESAAETIQTNSTLAAVVPGLDQKKFIRPPCRMPTSASTQPRTVGNRRPLARLPWRSSTPWRTY